MPRRSCQAARIMKCGKTMPSSPSDLATRSDPSGSGPAEPTPARPPEASGGRAAGPRERICAAAHEAVGHIRNGASLLVHSFGPPQAWPTDCLLALAERGVNDLTVICNTPAGGPTSLNILADKKQVRKLICSYVGSPAIPTAISEQVKAGEIELEMVPQGTLAERVRAGGAGLAGLYTPTGGRTEIAAGEEERAFDSKRYSVESAPT